MQALCLGALVLGVVGCGKNRDVTVSVHNLENGVPVRLYWKDTPLALSLNGEVLSDSQTRQWAWRTWWEEGVYPEFTAPWEEPPPETSSFAQDPAKAFPLTDFSCEVASADGWVRQKLRGNYNPKAYPRLSLIFKDRTPAYFSVQIDNRGGEETEVQFGKLAFPVEADSLQLVENIMLPEDPLNRRVIFKGLEIGTLPLGSELAARQTDPPPGPYSPVEEHPVYLFDVSGERSYVITRVQYTHMINPLDGSGPKSTTISKVHWHLLCSNREPIHMFEDAPTVIKTHGGGMTRVQVKESRH